MIEHYVARKSFFYVTGSIDSEKVVSLAEKFAGRYPTILAASRERTAAKKLKAPRVNLFLWPHRYVGKWTFLLASDRPLHGEKMHDCRRTSNRIIVNGRTTGYVNARRASGAWTWNLSEESYMYWRDQLNTAAQRGSGTLLQKHIDTLLRTTYMAGGVRTQVFSLLNEVKRTYENHRTLGRQHDVDLVVPKTIVKASA